jgi:hypothetical protein
LKETAIVDKPFIKKSAWLDADAISYEETVCLPRFAVFKSREGAFSMFAVCSVANAPKEMNWSLPCGVQ